MNVPRIGAQVGIGYDQLPGDLAQPVSLAIPVNGTMQLRAIGGLTKLEWMAGMVAGGNWRLEGSCEESVGFVVDIAQTILSECDRRQNAKANESAA